MTGECVMQEFSSHNTLMSNERLSEGFIEHSKFHNKTVNASGHDEFSSFN